MFVSLYVSYFLCFYEPSSGTTVHVIFGAIVLASPFFAISHDSVMPECREDCEIARNYDSQLRDFLPHI